MYYTGNKSLEYPSIFITCVIKQGGIIMNHTIVSVDGGNDGGKIVGWFGYDYYKTSICEWFERNVEERFSKDDMEFEIDGRKGFAGPIAAYESEFGASSMFGDTKAHEDAKVRILISISRYIDKYCPQVNELSITTGQPIKGHTPTEKEKITDLLLGKHEVVINGVGKTINIRDVKVWAEGSAAYWSNDELSKDAYILDVGSGTVNAAHIRDKKHINRMSDTFNFGTENVSNKDSLSRGVALNLTKLKWGKNEQIYVCGGIANEFIDSLKGYYSNATLLIPKFKQKTKISKLHPVFANAVGGFELAKRIYK
jgi:plasmid segregation protein ParM